MKFTVNRHQFLDRLSSVNRAINPNSSIPALSGTKVDVWKDHILLTGSDSNLIILSEIWPGELTNLQIEEPGSLVMDFRYVLEILRRMDGETLEFETLDSNLMRITDTSGEYNLNTMDSNAYPGVDTSAPEQHFEVPGNLLKDIFNHVSYAVSEKEGRPILTGVHLAHRDGTLACSATDSYRLAHKLIEQDLGFPFEITIPKKTMQEVVRLAGDKEMVQISMDRKRIQFIFNKNLIQSQLIEGSYPNVEKIIPDSFSSTLNANAQELERILERSTVFKDENASFLVTMKLAGDEVEITSQTSQLGSSVQNLFGATYTGEPLVVSLNGKYLLQAIHALESKDSQVKLEFNGSLKPIRITSATDEGTTMIVVPMRNSN